MTEDCFMCDKPLPECKCGETQGYSNCGPVCPYCGHEEKYACHSPKLYDESTEEWECSECEETFRLRVAVTYAWSTHRKES